MHAWDLWRMTKSFLRPSSDNQNSSKSHRNQGVSHGHMNQLPLIKVAIIDAMTKNVFGHLINSTDHSPLFNSTHLFPIMQRKKSS